MLNNYSRQDSYMNLMKSKKDMLHIYAENETDLKRNEVALNDIPGDFYTVGVNEKIPDNWKNLLATIEAVIIRKKQI